MPVWYLLVHLFWILFLAIGSCFSPFLLKALINKWVVNTPKKHYLEIGNLEINPRDARSNAHKIPSRAVYLPLEKLGRYRSPKACCRNREWIHYNLALEYFDLYEWKFKNSLLLLVLFFCSCDNPEQRLDFIVIHLQILPSQKSDEWNFRIEIK